MTVRNLARARLPEKDNENFSFDFCAVAFSELLQEMAEKRKNDKSYLSYYAGL